MVGENVGAVVGAFDGVCVSNVGFLVGAGVGGEVGEVLHLPMHVNKTNSSIGI